MMSKQAEKLGCPKCGYKGIIAYFNARGSAIICRRCGYHEGVVDDREAQRIRKSADVADENENEQLSFL